MKALSLPALSRHVATARLSAVCSPLLSAALSLAAIAFPLALSAQPVTPAPQPQPLAAPLAAAPYMEEVPFITSPDNVTQEMLRLAQVRAGDHVIDLGSGDGRIVILAAKLHGATGLGVEIVPELVERSIRYAREAGVADKVSFKIQDLFQTDLSAASVITMYLLPDVNLALRPRLLALKPGTRIVSHDWDMGDWKPDQTTEVPVPNKAVGLARSSKIHTWMVPAQIDGAWCGTGALSGWSLRVTQRFQEVVMQLASPQARWRLQGRLSGAALRTAEDLAATNTSSARLPAARWQIQGHGQGHGPSQTLRLQGFDTPASGPSAMPAGSVFQRQGTDGSCRR